MQTPRDPVDEHDGATAQDQQNRGYYYDDAHGYEPYDPDADEEDPPAEQEKAEN